jgi:hypothetical protein
MRSSSTTSIPQLADASAVGRVASTAAEVLSDSTARTDLVTKNQEYAAIETVRRSIVLAQEAMAGTMFERVEQDWVGHLLQSDSVLRMPEIGIEVPLAELYEGVEFPEAERQPS